MGFTALVVMAASQAQTAVSYPTQSIKIIVPFMPGKGMDTIARAVAPRLSERLGQPVVVQNQAGASDNIGSDVVAKSAPDGHTLLITANTMLMATQMTAKSSYNPITDFEPIGMTA